MAYREKLRTFDAWLCDADGTYPSWLQARYNDLIIGSSYIMFPLANNDYGVANDGDYILHDNVTGDMTAVSATVFAARYESIP